ncbi:MAG: hypothetical protein Q8K82_04215 [Gemmatimonadaceae bacterium]|nr:hypothetical protein [Gemmatimonadaceae bacterium]
MRVRPLLVFFFLSTSAIGALPASAQQTAARRPATARPGGIAGSEYVIVVTDQGFDAPEQVDAGLVNVRLFNRSRGSQRVVVLKIDRLDRLSSISDYLKSGDWNVPWINRMGGPESPPSGGVSSVSMVLDAGRYVVAQLPISPGTPGGALILGDVQELSVTRRSGSAVAMALPRTEATVNMFEWGYTVDGPLSAGRRTLRIDNKGQFEHMVAFVRLFRGRTLEQAVKWAERPSGPAPYESVGGTTEIGRGHSVNVTVDLMPGDYALLCTSFNPLSKKLHSEHGMVKQVRVVP